MKRVVNVIGGVFAVITYIFHFPAMQGFFLALAPAYLTVKITTDQPPHIALLVWIVATLWAYAGSLIGQSIEAWRINNLVENIPSPRIMLHPDMLKGQINLPEPKGDYNPVVHGEHIQVCTELFSHMVASRTVVVRDDDPAHIILTAYDGEGDDRISFLFIAKRASSIHSVE